LTFDPRYNEAGLSINEYVLETTSNVTSKLEALPLFSTFVNTENKKNIAFNFYVRPTLPWKIECEGLNFGRNAIIYEMETSNKTNTKGATETIIWTALILLTVLQSSLLFQLTSRSYSSVARVTQLLIFVLFTACILWWSLVNISEVSKES
jgi:hypothetical protein